eukprot:SAG31_NODE_2590_length_5426_cov_4.118265_3_plen_221_part_00
MTAHPVSAHLVADVVLITIFCIFRERITISIGVIEEAADCFLDLPTALVTPFFTFLVQIPVLLYGIYSTLYILSLRTFHHPSEQWVYSEDLKLILFFNFCGILWTLYTVSSVQYTTVAGACADWYFSFQDEDGDRKLEWLPVPKSFLRVLRSDHNERLHHFYGAINCTFNVMNRRYNFGSMIFGGCIITIVVVVKWIATYMIQQVMAQSPENKVCSSPAV